MEIVHILLLLFLLPEPFECAKILVYLPRIGYSHVSYIGRLADILVEEGHDVTVASIGLGPAVNTTGTKLAKVIRWEKSMAASNLDTKTSWNSPGFIGTVKMNLKLGSFMNQICTGELFEIKLALLKLITEPPSAALVCQLLDQILEQLLDNELIERLKAEKFELGLCEAFSVCAYPLFRNIGITNYVTALPTNIEEGFTETIGVSNNPSFVPGSWSQFMDVMSYWERFGNFMQYIGIHLTTLSIWLPNEEKLRQLSPKYCNLMEEIGRTSFLFVNSNEFLDFPRLVSPKVIFIGGIAIQEPKPLNGEYQKLMDSATDGAVLMSFGTMAKSSDMDQHLKDTFAGAFKSLPNVKFLWKYEDENDGTIQAQNIIKKRWIPQNDLLQHSNLRLFITHCGLNSLMESAYAGVPVICIPLFGDQLRNTKIAERQGIGIGLEKQALSSQVLAAAIHEILDNDKYQKTARRLAQMVREKPYTPRERFVRNVEFAIKFGPIRNFDIASNQLNFFQYYLLDIIIPLIVVLLFLTYISTRFSCWIIGRLLRRVHKSKTE